jgi:membrane protease YdiL (CAAX protease family)
MNALLSSIGFISPKSWTFLSISTAIWLGIMIAYSPQANKLASAIFSEPPNLDVFKPIQQSVCGMIFGIVIAWLFGGFIEEIFLRGIILQILQKALIPIFGIYLSSGLAIVFSGVLAGIIHLYQKPRGAIIITQLSILCGILFVINGNVIWSVIICHGIFDTIAFILYANKRSTFSQT